MAGIRDLWIGRLRLVTYDESFQEAIGDELILDGGVAALGARKPKRYAFTLPVHGTSLDADPYAAAQRMRRQIRSMTENTPARAQGYYMYAFLDPEQNGWLMLGAGTIQYANGGVTLGEYSLVMDEIYRVASDRTYRPARRVDWYDRRLSTTSRDLLGGRYSTDFAGLTGGVYAISALFSWLPPGATDVSGMGRALQSAYPVFTRESAVLAVVGQPYGMVLNFEQPNTKRHAADVVIYDRRGQGDWTVPYANLVTNPSFERDLANVVTSGANLTSGGAASRVTGQSYVGAAALQVSSTAAAQGAGVALGATITNATTLTWTIFMKGNVGGEVVQMYASDGTQFSSSFPSVTLTSSWAAYTFTTTGWSVGSFSSASMYLVVRSNSASAQTFFVDGMIAVVGSAQVPYFDGAMPGYAWTGSPHASTSQGPFGWLNPSANPSFEGGTAQWSQPPGAAFALTADDPVPPGQSLDVTATGQTAYAINATAGLGNSGMLVVPGQTLYVEGWVKLVNALSASASVRVGVNAYTAAGAVTATSFVSQAASAATPTGQWVRLAGTITVPAGVYAVAFLFQVNALAADAVHVRLDNALVCGATALGLPPAFNIPGYPNTRYFDGDSRYAGWAGAWAASPSVMWTNPEDSPGWEEAYGPEHPLNQADVPVLTNGICQVRAERAASSNNFSFAVDFAPGPAALGGGGWQEQGRWSFVLDGSVWPTWAALSAVAVVEWTSERAVIKVSFSPLGGGTVPTRRVDLYVTLQRGWRGPRFELYDLVSAGTPTSYAFAWEPSHGLAIVAASANSSSQRPAAASPGSPVAGNWGLSATQDPWVAVEAIGTLFPALVFVRERDDASFQWGVGAIAAPTLYASGNRARLTMTHQYAGSGGYAEQQLAFSTPGPALEAESIRNSGSATTAVVSDPGALAAPTAPTAATSTTGGTLPTATQYDYKISAYNATGQTAGSAQSNTVTTGAGSTNSNTVTITAVTGAAGYFVYRRTGATGSWVLIGTATGTAFTDTGQAAGSAQPPTSDSSGQTSSGGQFVTDTQTANTAATLTSTAAVPMVDGTYALFVRVRAFPSDTISIAWSMAAQPQTWMQADGSLSGSAPATYGGVTSMAWTWIYAGEVSVVGSQLTGATLTVGAWVQRASPALTPANSNAGLDAVALVPTQRNSGGGYASAHFDGARDQAANHLVDARAFAEVVQR